MAEPTQESLDKIVKFVKGFAEKSGTTMHPNPAVTDAVETPILSSVPRRNTSYIARPETSSGLEGTRKMRLQPVARKAFALPKIA